MDEQSRIIGKLEQFMESTAVDLKTIKDDIRSLNQFKWRVAGGAAVLGVLVSAIVEIFHIYSGVK